MCAEDIYNPLVFYRRTFWQHWDLFQYRGGSKICLLAEALYLSCLEQVNIKGKIYISAPYLFKKK